MAAISGADDEHQPEREVLPENGDAPIGVGVRADGEERRVAQVEQAGQADDDVQAQRQQHEDAGMAKPSIQTVWLLEDAERRHAAR